MTVKHLNLKAQSREFSKACLKTVIVLKNIWENSRLFPRAHRSYYKCLYIHLAPIFFCFPTLWELTLVIKLQSHTLLRRRFWKLHCRDWELSDARLATNNLAQQHNSVNSASYMCHWLGNRWNAEAEKRVRRLLVYKLLLEAGKEVMNLSYRLERGQATFCSSKTIKVSSLVRKIKCVWWTCVSGQQCSQAECLKCQLTVSYLCII